MVIITLLLSILITATALWGSSVPAKQTNRSLTLRGGFLDNDKCNVEQSHVHITRWHGWYQKVYCGGSFYPTKLDLNKCLVNVNGVLHWQRK